MDDKFRDRLVENTSAKFRALAEKAVDLGGSLSCIDLNEGREWANRVGRSLNLSATAVECLIELYRSFKSLAERGLPSTDAIDFLIDDELRMQPAIEHLLDSIISK